MSDPKMPDDNWDEEWDDDLGGDDDGALHDPLLQQVLDHAPDQAATPDVALRQSIRVLAHEAVAPSLPAGPVGAERPWWQRLLGIGGGAGSRMPWNAAFATVLVGVLVTVMWQREPVPGAAPDAPMQERPAAPVPAAPPAPVTPAPKPAEAPPPPPAPSVLDTALAESRAVTESAKRALDERDRERERQARQAAADREATLAADKAVERAQQALAREEAARMKAEPPLPPPVQWPPVMAPEPVAPAAPAVSAAPPSAALRAAPPAPSRAAGMAAPAPAPAPSQAPEPTFNALAQWTQLRISRNGTDSRVLPRAEARELGGLVGSAALAGVGSQPLAGAVDWRIALERDGEVLGVLELAGGQVRWREKGVPPGTGQPGAGALSSLRQALEEAR
ncbi:hypothetical protein [Variovorax arabinosiphilus]|uniref:hypothetical protein n=1 Tax=Variovorax arabinosiphilus TaxID=3053498 RepID=UPI002575BFA8|nr:MULTISPECIES: hypothetical protein [unclassified Variovorax]MDM0120849.1 hypothetical protein [Variovorax sp. J2L1-78]MDM0127239.1 hypothetical protein [Variovorax sp. J2L1-63]MDM0236229.1 hypothetical protein [Variovorax sp. J2R1-6]